MTSVIPGYARSVVRSSNLPASMRTLGFDVEAAGRALTNSINTGKRPADKRAVIFLK